MFLRRALKLRQQNSLEWNLRRVWFSVLTRAFGTTNSSLVSPGLTSGSPGQFQDGGGLHTLHLPCAAPRVA